MHRILVYGTLKRGQPNHHVMTEAKGTATFVGQAQMVDKWPLVIGRDFNMPFMLDNKGHGENVIGELWSIDDAKLEAIDELETHPELFTRIKIPVRLISGPDDKPLTSQGEEELVWVHLLQDFKPEMMSLAHHLEYDSAGDHGQRYVPRAERVQQCSAQQLIKLVKIQPQH